MMLLSTALQDDIRDSPHKLKDLQLKAICVITDAQWVVSFQIQSRDGVIDPKSAPKFSLCTKPSKTGLGAIFYTMRR